MLPDWLAPAWARLLGDAARLPHALLLQGQPGIGKRLFARELAQRLLCERAASAAYPCGRCDACHLFAAGTHPDLRIVMPDADQEVEASDEPPGGAKPEKTSTQIRIEQIRDLADFVGMRSHRQGWRVVILEPAEAMNVGAANALLKALEEPGDNFMFILVSDNPRRLLPTIVSRCRRIPLPKPSRAAGQAWLESRPQGSEALALLDLCGGAPLAALDLAGSASAEVLAKVTEQLGRQALEDPLAVADAWAGWCAARKGSAAAVDRPTLVGWMQKWLADLIALQQAETVRYFPAAREALARIAAAARPEALLACYNDFLRYRAVALHPLNPRLFFDDLLLRYQRAARGPAKS